MDSVTIARTINRDKLYEALAAAQGEFTTVEPNCTGKVYREEDSQWEEYRYADLAAIIGMCRKPLFDHGLCVSQSVSTQTADGMLQVHVTTTLAHSSGQELASSVMIPLSTTKLHAVGMAITLLRRYALNALLGIVVNGEDGGKAPPEAALPEAAAAAETAPPPVPQPEPASLFERAREAYHKAGTEEEIHRLNKKAIELASNGQLTPVEMENLEKEADAAWKRLKSQTA